MRQLTWLALTCLGGLALCRVLSLSLLATIGSQRALLRELRVKIADAREFTQQLPLQEEVLQQAQARYRALERRIASGQSIARMLETLKLYAQHHELELVAVQPRVNDQVAALITPGLGLAFRETPLTLRLTGRYRQLGEFLGELSNAPLIAFVKQLTLSKPQGDSAQLQAELLVALYVQERTAAP